MAKSFLNVELLCYNFSNAKALRRSYEKNKKTTFCYNYGCSCNASISYWL